MGKFFKSLAPIFNTIFHNRKIVIVSEGKASSITISRNFQLAALAVVLVVLFCVPFSAGKFIALSSSHHGVLPANASAEERMEVLQNDISLLQEYLKALHKYDNFELKKFEKQDSSSDDGKYGSRNSLVEMEVKRDDIMIEMKKRTLARIISIESFLKSAGLNYARITGKSQFLARAGDGDSHEGGPYIPATIEDIANSEQDNYLSTEFIDQMNYLFELQKIVNNLPFSNPLAYNKISSPFGVRHDPFNGSLSMHAGMDLEGEKNSPVAATGPGKVTWSGVKGAYGLMVEVNHGYGFTTRYGHLSRSIVREGDYVSRGQVIGIQGCSGRCTGDHVHYEVRVNDVPTNPVPYLIKASEIQYYYAKKL